MYRWSASYWLLNYGWQKKIEKMTHAHTYTRKVQSDMENWVEDEKSREEGLGKQIGKPTKLSNNGKEKPANGKGMKELSWKEVE